MQYENPDVSQHQATCSSLICVYRLKQLLLRGFDLTQKITMHKEEMERGQRACRKSSPSCHFDSFYLFTEAEGISQRTDRAKVALHPYLYLYLRLNRRNPLFPSSVCHSRAAAHMCSLLIKKYYGSKCEVHCHR